MQRIKMAGDHCVCAGLYNAHDEGGSCAMYAGHNESIASSAWLNGRWCYAKIGACSDARAHPSSATGTVPAVGYGASRAACADAPTIVGNLAARSSKSGSRHVMSRRGCLPRAGSPSPCVCMFAPICQFFMGRRVGFLGTAVGTRVNGILCAGLSAFTAYRAECPWVMYKKYADWAFYRKSSTAVEDCANACLGTKRCTGFEAPNDQSYCSLYFGMACSGPTSNGWSRMGGGPADGMTYVIKYACSPCKAYGGVCKHGTLEQNCQLQLNHCSRCDAGFFLHDKQCFAAGYCVGGKSVPLSEQTRTNECAYCHEGFLWYNHTCIPCNGTCPSLWSCSSLFAFDGKDDVCGRGLPRGTWLLTPLLLLKALDNETIYGDIGVSAHAGVGDKIVFPHVWHVARASFTMVGEGRGFVLSGRALAQQRNAVEWPGRFAVSLGGKLVLALVSVNGQVQASGSVVYVTRGDVAIASSRFEGNTAVKKGAALFDGCGGAITVQSGTLAIASSEFSRNLAWNQVVSYQMLEGGFGGAISHDAGVGGPAVFTLRGCNLVGNNATLSGGAMYFSGPDSMMHVTRSNFSANGAGALGGAISLKLADSTLTHSLLIGNTALTGGAVWMDTGTLIITACVLSANIAGLSLADKRIQSQWANDGGAIFVNVGAMQIDTSNFSNNWALGNGGAIYSGGATLHINGSSIQSNTAGNSGGALYVTGGNVSVSSTKLSKNHCAMEGAGIWAAACILSLSAVVMHGNVAGAKLRCTVLEREGNYFVCVFTHMLFDGVC